MFVEKWMTANPLTIPPAISISSAAIEMSRHKFRHIPVAESNPSGKTLLGMISKYDIARAFPNHLNPFSMEVTAETVPGPVSTIMTRNVISVAPDCAIEESASILRVRRINALPVVRHNKLVGIITESDIFAALLSMTGANNGAFKMIVESDSVKNPVLSLAQLSEKHDLEIQSLTSFHDHESKKKVESVLHFSNRPTPAFVDAISKLGFRIRSIS
jgi:acetoin utilization protein AcuB